MQCKKVAKSALLPTAPRQASDPLLLSATAPSIDQAMADTQMVMSTDEHESSSMHVSARLRKRPESAAKTLNSPDDASTISAACAIPISTEPSLEELTARILTLGYVPMPKENFVSVLTKSIVTRLCNRKGAAVYQAAAYNIQLFSRSVAEDLFNPALLQASSTGTLTWEATTQVEVKTLLGTLLEKQKDCAGATRALRTPSEKCIRVLSTIIGAPTAPLTISWADETLFLNFFYVLSDEAGELHYPKDNERREMLFQPEETAAIRAQILEDIKLMAGWGFPLSEGLFKLTGLSEEAAAAAAAQALLKPKRRKPKPLMPKLPKQKVSKKARVANSSSDDWSDSSTNRSEEEGAEEAEIEEILEERPSSGRARCWYLVRWDHKGYTPSWEAWRIEGEPGSPVQTWELAKTVEGTAAWQAWRTKAG